MLQRVGTESELNTEGVKTTFRRAHFPAPFREGLEYSSPARGTWNIVHTGMLIPESHQIFVCAQGCLRGVVLTAAEMCALDRYSAIQIREENVLDGGMEELMIEGVTDIIGKLSYRPRAILLFISCQHFFLAYNQKLVFATLRERFPDIRFVDCYMIPTLRKSGVTPDQKMRIQMYRMWERRPPELKNDGIKEKVNLIGSNLQTSRQSELVRMVESAGYEFWDLYRCQTFDDYMAMAAAKLNLVYEPLAIPAAEDLKRRLGQDYLYLTFSFDFDELEDNYRRLAKRLGIPKPDFSDLKEKALSALLSARELIGDTPVVLDYTFTFRILSFARLLLEQGFHVAEVFADTFLPEDEENFRWIRERFPDIVISATNRPKMRFFYPHDKNEENQKAISLEIEKHTKMDLRDNGSGEKRGEGFGKTGEFRITMDLHHEKVLALGQKAAYFCGTDYFVNVAESGGYYGFQGIIQIAALMEDAFLHKKDRKSLIQKKGFGCESCL